ncbi:MAG: ABC transporter permease [Sphingobacteriales bacterium]
MRSYFFHISLYELASLGTLFAGLTLALLLAFSKRIGQTGNLFLSSALLVIVLKTGGLTAAFLPALGPLLYFYVRQQTYPDRRFLRKDMLHFFPLLATYWMPQWLVLILIVAYLYLSHRLIQDFYSRLQPVLMDRPRFAFRWLDQLLLLLGLLCMLWLLNDGFCFAVAFALIGMAMKVMLKPDNSTELATPTTDRSDEREKSRRLREAVAVNRLYEDAELTLATLAVKLNIHPHDLSRIINVGLDKNFSDFINEFRVREIGRKMQDPAYDRLTLLGIAYESGFNSKRTFNRVFKEMTGKTPVEYKNILKKEGPIDKLALWSVKRPVILRSESLPNWAPGTLKRNIMLRNYLKIAYRQLLKQKMYAAIKIGGFAMGIAACLLIALYIRNETSYDKSYPDADRIYRVIGYYNSDGKLEKGTDFPAPMGKALKADFPEVEISGRLMPNSLFDKAGSNEVRRADKMQNSYEEGFTYADQEMLDLLKLPMAYGKRETALTEPLTMVISKRKADKYFPGEDPVGKLMFLNDDKKHPYRIGGVMENIPQTSHLSKFDFLLTMKGIEFYPGEQNNWDASNYPDYIKLHAGTNIAQFEKKITSGILKNYYLPVMRKDGVKDPEKQLAKFSLRLQPVPDINLYSYDIYDDTPHGDVRFIWLFGSVAGFILIIACINFINLSTAKSANRAKEVGLRKVVGSYRSSLINQFLAESTVYSFLSFALGMILAWALLPYFNGIASKSLVIPWAAWWFIPAMLISAVIVGIAAGLYPAFYLSSFKPVQVLKGSISAGSKSPLLRNSLVVFQFTISVILIVSTFVIYNEMQLILNRKVGFDKDQVVLLQGTNTLGDKVKSFKTELSKLSAVKSASISDYLPVDGTKRNGNTFNNKGEKNAQGVSGQFWQVDDTYLKTLGMKLTSGRNFSYAIASDSNAVIVNQTMVKRLNLKNPLGKLITNGYATYPIVGVVEDFNYDSMRGNIDPIVLHFGISPSIVSVKVEGADMKNTLANITALWQKYSPDQPIRYTFLDEQFANMYADVQRTGHIFTSFAILAIIIACLGLFALSAFMAEQRSKEIGIRKVLGATIGNITTLLSSDFIKLVLIAIIIASPIAWWAMNKWLEDFAYKTPVSWWIFALSGVVAIAIALITVSFQSIKAALMNPVKSLKSE